MTKETVDLDILIESSNGGRKILHPIRKKSGRFTRIRKWNQFSHFRRTSNRKNLDWLHFDDEARVQLLDQQFLRPVSLAYSEYSSNSQEHQPRHVSSEANFSCSHKSEYDHTEFGLVS